MIDKIVAAILDTPDASGGTLRQVVDSFETGLSPEPVMKIIARGVLSALREPDDALIERAAFAAYVSYACHVFADDPDDDFTYNRNAAARDWETDSLRTYPGREEFRSAARAAWAAALTEEPK